MKANSHLQRAFTLIELIVAMAIIGVLAVVAVPIYSDYIDSVRVVQAVSDIGAIATSLITYQISTGKFPASLAEVGAQNYLDPWKNPYQYLNLSDPSDKSSKGKARKDHSLVPINSDFDLYSTGKDGKSVSPLTAKASRDDIVRANNGRYIGLASQY